jgi:predicted nucleic acid-binding protein
MPDEFLDTNILVYAFTLDARAEKAEALLAKGGTVSVQGLNEFVNVARRKLGMTWAEVREALAAIRTLSKTVLPVSLNTHTEALRLAEQHSYGFFDALMIASALESGCNVLYSEDMNHGMLIDGRLRIIDPFRSI